MGRQMEGMLEGERASMAEGLRQEKAERKLVEDAAAFLMSPSHHKVSLKS